MSYLVDTCVISEVIRPRPAASVVAWLEAQDDEALFLSVIAFGEIAKGVETLGDAKRRAKLRQWLENDLATWFAGRVLAIDAVVAARWGALAGDAERRGRPAPVVDGLIAATALVHNMPVVTRNVADFESFGVACIDPWSER